VWMSVRVCEIARNSGEDLDSQTLATSDHRGAESRRAIFRSRVAAWGGSSTTKASSSGRGSAAGVPDSVPGAGRFRVSRPESVGCSTPRGGISTAVLFANAGNTAVSLSSCESVRLSACTDCAGFSAAFSPAARAKWSSRTAGTGKISARNGCKGKSARKPMSLGALIASELAVWQLIVRQSLRPTTAVSRGRRGVGHSEWFETRSFARNVRPDHLLHGRKRGVWAKESYGRLFSARRLVPQPPRGCAERCESKREPRVVACLLGMAAQLQA
jgi:hypothetical protein